LFGEDLTGWIKHPGSDTGLHFYDRIARISSNNDFWNSLIADFRTRYVIFEFKNYSGKISQQQIYSTEKYLFLTAMRATAIIISRKGANSNALAAARGALREAGKLILNFSLDDLCEMLHRKDEGDDALAVISERLDDMLIKLER
jgi:hypothetical protein